MSAPFATVAVTLDGRDGISYACNWCFLQLSGRPGIQTLAIKKNAQPCLIHKAYAEIKREHQRLRHASAQSPSGKAVSASTAEIPERGGAADRSEAGDSRKAFRSSKTSSAKVNAIASAADRSRPHKPKAGRRASA